MLISENFIFFFISENDFLISEIQIFISENKHYLTSTNRISDKKKIFLISELKIPQKYIKMALHRNYPNG